MFAGAGEPVSWGQKEATEELNMKPDPGGGRLGGVKGRQEADFP